MQSLPVELVNVIANYITKITDKRQFSMVCKLYNIIMKPKIKLQESTITIEHFIYSETYNMGKITLELCNDGYFYMIPDRYFCPHKNRILVKALTIYGQIELLNTALKKGCILNKHSRGRMDKLNDNTMAHAVISNKIEVLTWARLRGCEWNYETFELACKLGNLDMVKFMKYYGCAYGRHSYSWASFGGHKHVLEWLIDEEYDIIEGDESCQNAAHNGHFDVLKWLTDHGFTWDMYTCSESAAGGHLEILQYAITNGCDIDVSETFYAAGLNKQFHIIEWMVSVGCEWEIRDDDMQQVADWLVSNGYLNPSVCL
jgi:hypothetical protein